MSNVKKCNGKPHTKTGVVKIEKKKMTVGELLECLDDCFNIQFGLTTNKPQKWFVLNKS